MSEKVELYFRKNAPDLKVIYAAQSSATVALASEAFGTEPERIAKTLAFRLHDKDIVIVMSGTMKIDNRKYKDNFHIKAKMMTAEETLEILGHPIGGVCPFALDEKIGIYLDESLKKFEIVYPAGGSTNSAVEITPERLAEVTGGEWIDVCK